MGKSSYGFTLIELVITLAILGILATMAMPMAELAVKRSHEQELRYSLRQIREAIDAYKQAWDEGRMMHKVGESGYPPTLEVLVEGIEDVKNPNGGKMYFLRRIPRDPFSKEKNVETSKTWGKRSSASPADDPKEGDDIFDVYSLSEEVGINGVPYRQW